MQAVSDEQLIQWVADGDPSCLGTLFERHHRGLYNYALQLTRNAALSEDLVQELFVRLLAKAASFRGDASFKSWAYHILRNLTFDQLRKAANRKTDTDSAVVLEQELIDIRSAERSASDAEELKILAQSVARLPIDQQDIIWLGRFEFPDYQSLAVAVGCTPAAARVRMHRALKALTSAFEIVSGVVPNV